MADSLPPMLKIIHERVERLSLQNLGSAIYYLKEMAIAGLPWSIKYEQLIYDILNESHKKRANLTIIGSCFMACAMSHLLSLGVVHRQSKNLIEFIKSTLLPHILNEKKSIDKNQICALVWTIALAGECIEVPQSLLLYFINTGVVNSLSKANEISRMLWGFTYFYIQSSSNELTHALKKSMNILFKKLELCLEKRDGYPEKELKTYTKTLVLAAFWLNIYVDVYTLTSYYDYSKVNISKSQETLLKNMRKFFNKEIIESEKGEAGFSPLDILLTEYRFGVEFQGPFHYSDHASLEMVGSTIIKLMTYRKKGYTVIGIPVVDISDEKVVELFKEIKQHIDKCKQPIGLNLRNRFDVFLDEPTK